LSNWALYFRPEPPFYAELKITAANFQMKDTAAVIRLFFNPDAIRPQPI
jgi:hypothetical protein